MHVENAVEYDSFGALSLRSITIIPVHFHTDIMADKYFPRYDRPIFPIKITLSRFVVETLGFVETNFQLTTSSFFF